MRNLPIFILVAGLLLVACGGGATSTPVRLSYAELAAIFLRYASMGDVENASDYYCEYMKSNMEGDTFVRAFSNMGAEDFFCTMGPYPESARCTYRQTRDITGKAMDEQREIILNMVDGKFCGVYEEPTPKP